jgi:hypothetical protein
MRSPSIAAIFCSGVFFGGAIDHAILALKRSHRSPYGLAVGVRGNWLLALVDAALAGILYARHLSGQQRVPTRHRI